MIPGEGLRWAGDQKEQRGDGLGWVRKESYAATSKTYRNIQIKEGNKQGEN